MLRPESNSIYTFFTAIYDSRQAFALFLLCAIAQFFIERQRFLI